MSDPGPLIVPIDVKAMVHNNPATAFIRGTVDYGKLASFDDPSPAPFQNEGGDDFSNNAAAHHGVYLMWTLPKALRHGSQQAGGRFTFPYVPNRWLVVRLLHAADAAPATPPAAAAWVVQSDSVNASERASAYIDPNSTTAITPIRIGRKAEVTAAVPWQEPAAAVPFLTAVAESNPAFAAYQPFNENVFSLFDNLAKQNIGRASLSYFVLGWYAQPSADVLFPWTEGSPGKDFPDLLDTLGWSLTGTTADAPRYTGPGTRTSLYHGGAFAVSWVANGPAPTSDKDKIKPQVALANTGIDAVLAFAHAAFAGPSPPPAGMTPDQATELLAAFQYNILPMFGTPGAEMLVEQTIRTNWFGSSDAGTNWSVVPAETKPGEDPPPQPSADELAAEATWLAGLNDAQSRLDIDSRDLASAQRQLFEMWWKKGDATVVANEVGHWPLGTSSAQFDDRMPKLIDRVRDAVTARDGAAREVSTGLARTMPGSRVRKPVAEPRFWAPADPVMVVSNTAHTLVIDHAIKLRCRLSTELVGAINVIAGTTATVKAEQLKPMRPAVNWTNLTPLAEELFAEFFLLDPSNAGLIAAAAGRTGSDLDALATSMSPPHIAGGIVPAVLAPYPWKQPWHPLYVDWQIDFLPIPFQQASGAANWVFRGLDYDLAPGAPEPTDKKLELIGRTVLTPKPSFDFKSRIDQFITDYPDSAAAKQLKGISDLIKWDFLSQTISGLHTWLAGRSPLPSAHPDATPLAGGGNLRDLIGDAARLPPHPVTLGSPRHHDIPPSTFEGMRCGQFYVNRLTVVDAFGQTLEIVQAPDTGEGNRFPHDRDNNVFHPLLGDGLVPTRPVDPDEPLRFAQLPPRVLQPARLNFRFEPAANGNAIIGWVLPNHLDSGLSAYGPDGSAYGVLRLGVAENGDPAAVWDAAPGSPYPDDLPAPSSELGDFVNILANLKARGAVALGEFLKAVDETLWSIDPLGGRSDTFLSVLIGQPLALVVASLSFELSTEAWRDSDWPQTFVDPPPDPLFLRYQFPVRLGDLDYRQDGLIGYFKRGKYDVFNNIHHPETGPKAAPQSDQPYLQPIAPGNYVNIGFAAKGPGTPASLILLMDPRASVHAQCGILPVKEIALPAAWVDEALAKIAVTFRTGPIVTGQQAVKLPGTDTAVPGLLWPSPAEHHGTWTWVERAAAGWAEMPLAPVDASAKFAPVAPTLRDGLLKLSGGLKP